MRSNILQSVSLDNRSRQGRYCADAVYSFRLAARRREPWALTVGEVSSRFLPQDASLSDSSPCGSEGEPPGEIATACRFLLDWWVEAPEQALRGRREGRRWSGSVVASSCVSRSAVWSVKDSLAAGPKVAGGGGRAMVLLLWWEGPRVRRRRPWCLLTSSAIRLLCSCGSWVSFPQD